MDIQVRKQLLIEDFLKISDESVIERLEAFFRKERSKHHDDGLKPMSLVQFYGMIDSAMQDKDNGRVITHDDLKKKIKSW